MLYVMRLRAICIETIKAVNDLNPAFISKMFSRNNNEYDFDTAIKLSHRTYAHSYAVRTPFAIRDLNYGMSFHQIWRKLHPLHISNLWWRNGMVLLVVVGRALFVNSQALNWIDPGYTDRNVTHSNLRNFSNCVLFRLRLRLRQTQTEFYSTSIEITSITSGCKNQHGGEPKID